MTRSAHSTPKKPPSIHANLATLRDMLKSAERMLGIPIPEAFDALHRLESQVNDLRRDLREARRLDE